MYDRLTDVKLAVGKGENYFTMSRGSFRYRQLITEKQRLRRVSVTNGPGSVAIRFAVPGDPSQGHFVVTIEEQKGRKVLKVTPPEGSDKNRFWLTFPTDPKEHLYGCGETHSDFDLKGLKVRVFVAEHQNARRISDKMIRETLTGVNHEFRHSFAKYESYYAQPTFTSSRKYYVHADLSAFSVFDFSKPSKITIYTQEPPVLVTEKAASFEALSGKLADLLGHQRELPDWVYDGAILAVQQGPDVIEQKIEKALAAGVKVCGIWSQDWCGCRKTGFGYQVMWNWEQDRELYPDLPKKIAAWKKRGIRFLGYINPFLALEKDLYKYASEKGYCVKDKKGNDYLVTTTTFPSAMVDFTNPEACAWYKSIIRNNMIGIGMGGWMADFGEYLPLDCVLFSGEDPQFLHNRWPAIWAQLNREAVEEAGASGDVFFFTRAGHTGTVGASDMMWTGDQHVDWSVDHGLPSVIPATLSLAMSGFGLTHSDIGGYTTIMKMNRSKELLLRWEEMNAFTPLFRSHEGNQPGKNVQFDDDEELLAQLARFSRVYIALKPYLKALVKENAERGVPVMRPLFYHYEEQRAFTEMREYLLGRDLLVAPVITPDTTERTVYLPDDTWVHLFTGEEYGGGEFVVDAPVGMPPVFVRKGSPRAQELLAITETIEKKKA